GGERGGPERGPGGRRLGEARARREGSDRPGGGRWAGGGGGARGARAPEPRQAGGRGDAAAEPPAEPPVRHQAAEGALEGDLGHAATGTARCLAHSARMRPSWRSRPSTPSSSNQEPNSSNTTPQRLRHRGRTCSSKAHTGSGEAPE